jgi:hypothetical protein
MRGRAAFRPVRSMRLLGLTTKRGNDYAHALQSEEPAGPICATVGAVEGLRQRRHLALVRVPAKVEQEDGEVDGQQGRYVPLQDAGRDPASRLRPHAGKRGGLMRPNTEVTGRCRRKESKDGHEQPRRQRSG